MDILGIGASELIFIIIIALIVLGPKDMQKAGKTIGRWLNQLVRSDGWKVFQKTSREMRNLPTNLMREANMDLNEAEKDIRKAMAPTSYKPLASSPSRNLSPSNKTENSIQPPPPFAEPTETPDSPATGNDPESTTEKND
jgi:sec-independent protein translocase protein TatB